MIKCRILSVCGIKDEDRRRSGGGRSVAKIGGVDDCGSGRANYLVTGLECIIGCQLSRGLVFSHVSQGCQRARSARGRDSERMPVVEDRKKEPTVKT